MTSHFKTLCPVTHNYPYYLCNWIINTIIVIRNRVDGISELRYLKQKHEKSVHSSIIGTNPNISLLAVSPLASFYL